MLDNAPHYKNIYTQLGTLARGDKVPSLLLTSSEILAVYSSAKLICAYIGEGVFGVEGRVNLTLFLNSVIIS